MINSKGDKMRIVETKRVPIAVCTYRELMNRFREQSIKMMNYTISSKKLQNNVKNIV